MRNDPHTIYRNEAGIRVPSVTTFLGVAKAVGPFIDWAWNLGLQQIDYKKVRDTAADTGTLVHYLALCELTGQEPDFTEWTDEERNSTLLPMAQFHKWRDEHEIEPILMETPFVSEKHQFGGTPDFYGLVDGVKTLVDFKTGKAIYEEYYSQVAAYAEVLEEHGYPIEDIRILRMSKEVGDDGDYKLVTNRDMWFTIFLDCQDIYILRREARKNKKGFVE